MRRPPAQRRAPSFRSPAARSNLESLEPRLVMATFNVNSFADILSPPAGTVTLRSAIEAASTTAGPNTIVLPYAGTYRLAPGSGDLTYTGTSNLTITNTSGGAVTVDAAGQGTVFAIDPSVTTKAFTVTFERLDVTGGDGGGGIFAVGAAGIAFDSGIVTGNQTFGDGEGIYMGAGSTGSLTVNSSQITDNTAFSLDVFGRAPGDGGGIATEGSGPITIDQSLISGNTADGGGGGICVKGGVPVVVTGSTVSDNTAFASATSTDGGGGGIDDVGSGAVSLVGDIIQGNSSDADGGGFDDGGLGKARLSAVDSFFLGNSPHDDGGGIAASGPIVAITDTEIEGNVATSDSTGGGLGGGLYIGPGTSGSSDPSASAVTVAGSTIADNRSYSAGGGIDHDGSSLALSSDTIDGNHSGEGGGLNVSTIDTVVSADNSLFLDNKSLYDGGGIDQEDFGRLDLNDDEFTGNLGAYGAAVDFAGSGPPDVITTALAIADTTFNANAASASGGAVYVSLTSTDGGLTNDTFTGNAAISSNSGAYGGAIYYTGSADATPTLALVDDTINDNSATTAGGGLYQGVGTLIAENTILAQNTAAGSPSDYDHGGGTVTDRGGNLIGTTSGAGGYFTGDTFTGSLDLGPLLDNGSDGAINAGAPTSQQVISTEALLPGSPAFGRGLIGCGLPKVDERGFPRGARQDRLERLTRRAVCLHRLARPGLRREPLRDHAQPCRRPG